MKYCKSCGAVLLDGFRFCVQCGATVDPDQPESEAPVTPEAGVVLAPAAPAAPVPDNDAVSGLPEYVPEPPAAPEEFSATNPCTVPESPTVSQPVQAPLSATVARPNPFPMPEPAPEPVPQPAGANSLLEFDGAFVALLLFCIPVVGLITGIIWALGGAKNPSRKNLARAYLLLLLAVCLFAGCMALLLWLIAGDQMSEFFKLFHSWLQTQAAVLPFGF